VHIGTFALFNIWPMTDKNIIKVSKDAYQEYTYFSSLKKACKAKGWKYNTVRNMTPYPIKFMGYTIYKLKVNELNLRDFFNKE